MILLLCLLWGPLDVPLASDFTGVGPEECERRWQEALKEVESYKPCFAIYGISENSFNQWSFTGGGWHAQELWRHYKRAVQRSDIFQAACDAAHTNAPAERRDKLAMLLFRYRLGKP